MTRRPWSRRLARCLLPPGSHGDSILGDVHAESQRQPKRWRNAWFWAVIATVGCGYAAERARCFVRTVADRSGATQGWFHDARSTLRSLASRPAHVGICAAILALGIASTTTIFSIVNASLLRPLPYFEPGRLLRLADVHESSAGGHSSMSLVNLDDLSQRSRQLSAVVATMHRPMSLSGRGDAERLAGLRVSVAFLDTLGVRPQLGRDFVEDDILESGAPSVILADGLWRTRFAADREVVGQVAVLDLVPHRIVGVLPPDFRFLGEPQVLVALAPATDQGGVRSRRWVDGIGRLAPGATLDSAREELSTLSAELAREHPEANAGWSTTARPLHEALTGSRRGLVLMFAAAAALLLTIACVNVANLTLTRAVDRAHEFAVRAALGSGRARLRRLLLLEGVSVGLLGGVLGVLLAALLLPAFMVLYGDIMPRAWEIELDRAALGFGVAVAVGSGALIGISAGILRTRSDAVVGVRNAGNVGHAMDWMRRSLVAAQLVLAVVLVNGAVQLSMTVWSLSRIDLGVPRQAQVVLFAVELPPSRYAGAGAEQAFWAALRRDLLALPGIEAVGFANRLPLMGGTNGPIAIDRVPDDNSPDAEIRAVNRDYLEALGLRLLAGRHVAPDAAASEVVVNAAFARERAGALQGATPADVLGHQVRIGWSDDSYSVVGVVADIREFGPLQPPRPTAYWDYDGAAWMYGAYRNVLVRTAGRAVAAVPAIRRVLRALDADVPLTGLDTLERIVTSRVGADRRATRSLLVALAATALLLSAVGIYGMMSAWVRSRQRELAVRVALGARSERLLIGVVGATLRITIVALVLGSAASWSVGRQLAALVHDVAPLDARVVVVVVATLLFVVLVAALQPSLRAARTDPAGVLRAA